MKVNLAEERESEEREATRRPRSSLLALRFPLFIAAFFIGVAAADRDVDPNEPISGMWAATLDDDRLQLNLMRGKQGWSNYGLSISLQSFSGLTSALVQSPELTPVSFELRKEAGTLGFTGHFRSEQGSGHYRFTSSDSFARQMATLGYSNLTQKQLFSMALHDITAGYVKEMRSLGYGELTADELIKLGIHQVTPDFIRELRTLGYSGLSVKQLKKMGIHGAGPAFIRELQAAGFRNLSAEQLVKMRIHGATASYIREIRELGFREITPEQLIKMRIHGIDSEYVRAMRKP